MSNRKRFYVGIMALGTQKEVFSAAATPTSATHPQYDAAIGPFHTRAGAELCANNRTGYTDGPRYQCSTVADYERFVREQRTTELPVIFRAIQESWGLEILALFPTLIERQSAPTLITCYAHVGQHGCAHIDATQEGRPATPAEYADLLAELRGIYETSHAPGDPIVKLRVISRRPAIR